MNMNHGVLAALAVSIALAGCAATGTRATSTSQGYKDLARSQQWWCGTFGQTCTCTIDDMKTTCSLAFSCVQSGNCKTASQ